MATGVWGITDPWGTGSWSLGGFAPVIDNFVPLCGSTNLAPDQTIQFDVVDPNPTNPGIDLNNTTVTVQIGATTTEVAYTGGAFDSGWSGSSTNSITGGYRFSLVRTANYTSGATITITIFATTSSTGATGQKVCTFTIRALAAIESVEFISLDKILVTFSVALKSSDELALTTVANWSVRPVAGNRIHSSDNATVVRQVIPEQQFNPTFVVIDVGGLVPHQRYEIKAKNFDDIFHQSFVGNELLGGEARRTKVDSMLSNLPVMWEGSRASNLFWLLSGIAREDESIGGSQGIIATGSLRRLF